VASIQDHLQKIHHYLCVFGEFTFAVSTAAFPVKHDAVRVNTFYVLQQFFYCIGGWLLSHAIINIVDSLSLTCIHQDLGSFEGFLLDTFEQVIVSVPVEKGYDNCRDLLGLILLSKQTESWHLLCYNLLFIRDCRFAYWF